MLLERLHLVQSGQAIGQIEDAKLSTAHYIRIRLHGWMAALMCADIVGAIVLSLIIFNVYAEPLNYERTQLWAGLGGFIVAWGVAAHSQGLYERGTTLSGRRMLFLKTIASCAIAFGLLLLLAFGFKFIGGVSRLWLIASGASTCLWLLVVRLAFRHRLETMFRSGYCLDPARCWCAVPWRADTPPAMRWSVRAAARSASLPLRRSRACPMRRRWVLSNQRSGPVRC